MQQQQQQQLAVGQRGAAGGGGAADGADALVKGCMDDALHAVILSSGNHALPPMVFLACYRSMHSVWD